MRIIFCGEDSFSARVLESLIFDDHEILAVFCPIYQNYIYARLKLICEKHNIQFHRIKDVNSEENESYIRKLNPDLISVCHFQKILKKNIIKIPVYGCINLHPSLLPNYRGLSPQHWPIINGDNETGITVHFINEEIDKGDIILQQKIAIGPQMYVSDLQITMLSTYEYIVKDAIALLTQKKIKPIPQNHLEGSYYGKLKEDQCYIDLNGGYVNAYNLIRGVSEPYFGARLNGYRIWRTSLAPKEVNQKIKAKYEENNIYFDERFGAFIKFSDGSLIIEKYDKLN
jgi:methionyl-tRNA formyltransferase